MAPKNRPFKTVTIEVPDAVHEHLNQQRNKTAYIVGLIEADIKQEEEVKTNKLSQLLLDRLNNHEHRINLIEKVLAPEPDAFAQQVGRNVKAALGLTDASEKLKGAVTDDVANQVSAGLDVKGIKATKRQIEKKAKDSLK